MFVSDLLCSLDRLSIYVWCACPSTQNHGNSGPPNENAVTLGQQAGGPSRRPHTRPRGGSRAFDGGCLAFVVGRDLTKRGGSWKQMSPNAERLSYQCTTTLASAEHLVGIRRSESESRPFMKTACGSAIVAANLLQFAGVALVGSPDHCADHRIILG